MTVIKLDIPTALSVRPARALCVGGKYRLHPTWSPIITNGYDVVDHKWPAPRITSHSENLLTFNKKVATGAELSDKARRVQSWESGHEYAHYQDLEVDPTVIDLQLQGLQMVWATPEGPRTYTLDAIYQTDAGSLVGVEVKASQSYFAEPSYAALMKRAEADLAQVGIEFKRVTRTSIEKNVQRRRNVVDLFDCRSVGVFRRDTDSIINTLTKSGPTPLGALRDQLGGDSRVGDAKLKAMIAHRAIMVDIDLPIDAKTLVHIPPLPKTPRFDLRSINI